MQEEKIAEVLEKRKGFDGMLKRFYVYMEKYKMYAVLSCLCVAFETLF